MLSWFTSASGSPAAWCSPPLDRNAKDRLAVKLKLYKGNIINAGAHFSYSLYSEEIATFGGDHVYDQKDAAGFINLFGLPIAARTVLLKESASHVHRIH